MNDGYTPLKLVYRIDGVYVPFDDPPVGEIRQNLLKVLEFYDVPHVATELSGPIFVPRAVAEDHEMIYNYVKKADDPRWMARFHKS